MLIDFLGSSKTRKVVAAAAALGVAQVSLVVFADAPAPWVQKADQKKKKKKAVRRAERRPVEPVRTVQTTPEPAPQPQVVEAPVYQAPVAPPAPEPVAAPAPAPAPAPAAEALAVPQGSKGTGWLIPVIGVLAAGGIIAAASASN